jgi:hypothetical protein
VDLDPCSRLCRSRGLAIQIADCLDWAFCLSLAMVRPQLAMGDFEIGGVLRQLGVQDGGDN